MDIKLFTSEQVLKDPYCVEGVDLFRYQMTPGELKWLEFVRGRYTIADYLYSTLNDEGVVTIDLIGLSEAIYADNGNYPKAACLSDETALQHIIFYNFMEQEAE